MFKNKKKILFLTGTRADFGKLKSLIQISEQSSNLDVYIFVTGMHLQELYGYTVEEIKKSHFQNIYLFKNHQTSQRMDRLLAKTIEGFSDYIASLQPDLIIVHGDRVEALAGAISGSLQNILVAHIEGGEISGTIDELIRHAVSKMSHIHFVSNPEASNRLLQLGELKECIHIIGSPDLDLMNPEKLADFQQVARHYEIKHSTFSIAMFHPVTTEIDTMQQQASDFVDALIASNRNYILIYPNNDLGSKIILKEYGRLQGHKNFNIFPSLKFEYFLTLLFHCQFIIGNSSAALREAPYYGVPSINIGSRQKNRAEGPSILNADSSQASILNAIQEAENLDKDSLKSFHSSFGSGDSDKQFINLLSTETFWEVSRQKQFQDL